MSQTKNGGGKDNNNNNSDNSPSHHGSNNNTLIVVRKDEPRYSSAALCLQFQLGDALFRPEYTHQCVSDEWFRGYQPYHTVLQRVLQEEILAASSSSSSSSSFSRRDGHCSEDDNNNHDISSKTTSRWILHKSHRYHEQATRELDIRIQLAPSCTLCHVTIHIQKKRKSRSGDITGHEHTVKRLKGGGRGDKGDDEEEEEEVSIPTVQYNNHHDHERNENGGVTNDGQKDEQKESVHMSNGDADDDDDDDDDAEEALSENNVDNSSGSTRIDRMPESEILKTIDKALPEVVPFQVESSYLSNPIGRVLNEYSVATTKNGMDETLDFVISLANGRDKEVTDYHTQVQKLAFWYIETADPVDVGTEDSGFWMVLYLFQKHSSSKYSLVGYVTLFHFHAPFHKPEPGIIVRICQALILKPYQRQGHGQRMIHCIYDLAHGKYPKEVYDCKIVQVNVEDPSPAFIALRNRVDVDWIQEHMEWLPVRPLAISDPDYFATLSDAQAQTAAVHAKIIPRQIHIVYEILRLKALQEYHKNGDMSNNVSGTSEDLDARFRLMVKKRLNKEHREEMSGLPTKAAKQAFLGKLFEKELKRYELLLGCFSKSC